MFAELHLPVELQVDRDDVEDAVVGAIEGAGQVSGSGTGIYGSNLDLDLGNGIDLSRLTAAIAESIAALGISGARIRFEGDDNWRPL